MKGIFFKGDVKNVLKELEAVRNWTVWQLINRCRIEEAERKQIEDIFKRSEAGQ